MVGSLAVAAAIGIGAVLTWRWRRHPILLFWAGFALQVLIAVSLQVGEDIASRFFAHHGSPQGVANAQHLVAFEAAHGFWLEPAWQMYFQHTHRLLAFTVTWHDLTPLMNRFYIWGHLLITLGAAMWIYVYHRRFFPFVRNTCVIVNAIALVLYAAVPVSPPRLTPGLTFRHHAFVFQDTVFGNSGTWGGYYRFNEFAAMPSVHVSWALIVTAAVFLLAKQIWVKALSMAYPFVVLTVIVVTGNHFFLDGIVGAGVALAAAAVACIVELIKPRLAAIVASRAGRGGGRERHPALGAPLPPQPETT